jgi:hypothetical protein
MEKHGFVCWSCVPDQNCTCLLCTKLKQKNKYVADKIVAKFYYERNRIVNEEVAIEVDVIHPEHSFMPRFDQ